jgi:nucleotide-binding universal stress UspA family protein
MAGTGLIVGIDGTDAGDRALAFAKGRAKGAAGAALTIVYVIEWSPFTFQTPEENEERHVRREQELALAHERVLDPAVAAAKSEGLTAEGIVRHGDAAEILEAVAVEKGAAEVVVGRSAGRRLKDHFFGSVSSRLAATSTVPVIIVP